MYVTNTLNVFFEVSRSLFYITKFSHTNIKKLRTYCRRICGYSELDLQTRFTHAGIKLPDLIKVMAEPSIMEKCSDLVSEMLYWKWLHNKQMDTH